MYSNMVKPEKNLHLIYHFIVRLNRIILEGEYF